MVYPRDNRNWWISFFNMRCLRSPVAILMAFFFRQNPISSLISCVRQRGQRLEMSYLGWTVSKSLKASSGSSVRTADSYSERILSICMTADMKFTRYTSFAITAYPIHVYYWLSFYHSLHFTFAFGWYKGHYTYPMVAHFSIGILAHFPISIYTRVKKGYLPRLIRKLISLSSIKPNLTAISRRRKRLLILPKYVYLKKHIADKNQTQ